jgi:hypothetical protein
LTELLLISFKSCLLLHWREPFSVPSDRLGRKVSEVCAHYCQSDSPLSLKKNALPFRKGGSSFFLLWHFGIKRSGCYYYALEAWGRWLRFLHRRLQICITGFQPEPAFSCVDGSGWS